MRPRMRCAGLVSAAACALAVAGIAPGVAHAQPSTAVPYSDPHALGAAHLLDPAGQLVIGGPSNVPLAEIVARVVATGPAEAGWRGDDPAAKQYGALAGVWTPVPGRDPMSWSGEPFGPTYVQPDPHQPPIALVDARTPSLEGAIAVGGGASGGSAAGYYEVRLVSVNDDKSSADRYYTVDLHLDASHHTFSVVGPGAVPSGVVASPVPSASPRSPVAVSSSGSSALSGSTSPTPRVEAGGITASVRVATTPKVTASRVAPASPAPGNGPREVTERRHPPGPSFPWWIAGLALVAPAVLGASVGGPRR